MLVFMILLFTFMFLLNLSHRCLPCYGSNTFLKALHIHTCVWKHTSVFYWVDWGVPFCLTTLKSSLKVRKSEPLSHCWLYITQAITALDLLVIRVRFMKRENSKLGGKNANWWVVFGIAGCSIGGWLSCYICVVFHFACSDASHSDLLTSVLTVSVECDLWLSVLNCLPAYFDDVRNWDFNPLTLWSALFTFSF